VADELVQSLMPSRSVDAADLVADIAGLAFVWSLTAPRPRVARIAIACSALALGGYVTYNTHVLLIEYSRGLRREQQQDFAGAYDHYRRALDNGLQTANLYNALAWAQTESGRGDPREAVEYARLALSQRPGNADILDTYGWALHRAGRSAEALPPLLEAYEKSPGMFCIHYHLAAVYLALGKNDLAAQHLRQQLKRPDTREAMLAQEALAQMGTRP
jgi:tetratricopeptide (TPR) repeat protein